jgi:hypothetical protein
MPSDSFDRALRQWEAKRDIAALSAQRTAIHDEAAAKVQPLTDEIKRIEAEVWPQDFQDATTDAELVHEYWRLRYAGIASFDDLEDASDEELLAIKGIGPAKLKRLREFQAEWAE